MTDRPLTPEPTETGGKYKEINITTEMKNSFLDYAMSVIVSRALPDVRDGLKPVHRRIIYGMNDMGMHAGKSYNKSARITGEVMGKYHPHGDAAIYDALVRLAQDFSTRYMLVDGHGNFGSIDGDGAAAARYTEARMSKISMSTVADINKNTVDFVDNYDGKIKEPTVLPSRIPTLLVNGATGIAVGMATNIPPHNLGEVLDAVIALSHNSEMDIFELMEYVKGPDFPTGAQIIGQSGIIKAYHTGQGSIMVRSKVEVIKSEKKRHKIIVREIPYQLNKTSLIEKIALLAKEKRVEGIVDIRDESSNREGIKLVIEIKNDANADVVLSNLYKYTPLQSNFAANMIALVDGKPQIITLKDALYNFLKFQKEIITRRTQFDLDKALARTHIIEGLKIAVDNIDEVIEIIKASASTSDAQIKLIERFSLSEIQAKAILEMRLQNLTGLQIERLDQEYRDLLEKIAYFRSILDSEEKLLEVVRAELLEVKEKHGDPRRTELIENDEFADILDEDLIPRENVVITITKNGYVKRLTSDTYRAQNRGGRGVKGLNMYEDDFVEHLLYTNTHHPILMFTNKGKVYTMKGYRIPEFGRNSKGMPLINVLNLEDDEKVTAIISAEDFGEANYLIFTTKFGLTKKVDMSNFASIRANGKRAINFKEDDELVAVRRTSGDKDVIIGASNGKLVWFNEADNLRPMGRTAAGVRGIRLEDDECVIGMEVVSEDSKILVISENGYGKITPLSEYRQTSRGSKGVKTINISDKTGKPVAVRLVTGNEDLMITTDKGMIIRLPVSQISELGRATQGVRLINLKGEQTVVGVAIVPSGDDSDNIDNNSDEDTQNNTQNNENSNSSDESTESNSEN